MATLQPLTGDRATGTVDIQLKSGVPPGLLLPFNTYLIPLLSGQIRAQMLIKLAKNPDREDGAWEVLAGGVNAACFSNIGGERYNFPAGTQFIFEEPLIDFVEATAAADFVGGTNPNNVWAVKDIVEYETLNGPVLTMDIRRSGLKDTPAILVTFEDIQPGDGAATSTTQRGTRQGTRQFIYKFTYTVSVITTRSDSDQFRRNEGLAIVDRVLTLLNDRSAVDGYVAASPGGWQIRSVFRENGPQDIYQKFYIYHVLVSATGAIVTEDSRIYAPWLLACMDVVNPQSAGDETSITVVDDMCVEMNNVLLATDPDGDILVTEEP